MATKSTNTVAISWHGVSATFLLRDCRRHQKYSASRLPRGVEQDRNTPLPQAESPAPHTPLAICIHPKCLRTELTDVMHRLAHLLHLDTSVCVIQGWKTDNMGGQGSADIPSVDAFREKGHGNLSVPAPEKLGKTSRYFIFCQSCDQPSYYVRVEASAASLGRQRPNMGENLHKSLRRTPQHEYTGSPNWKGHKASARTFGFFQNLVG